MCLSQPLWFFVEPLLIDSTLLLLFSSRAHQPVPGVRLLHLLLFLLIVCSTPSHHYLSLFYCYYLCISCCNTISLDPLCRLELTRLMRAAASRPPIYCSTTPLYIQPVINSNSTRLHRAMTDWLTDSVVFFVLLFSFSLPLLCLPASSRIAPCILFFGLLCAFIFISNDFDVI